MYEVALLDITFCASSTAFGRLSGDLLGNGISVHAWYMWVSETFPYLSNCATEFLQTPGLTMSSLVVCKV